MLSNRHLQNNHGISVPNNVQIERAEVDGRVARNGKQFDRLILPGSHVKLLSSDGYWYEVHDGKAQALSQAI